MQIDVITHYSENEKYELAGRTAIVIDVLRCTSVIVTAIGAGCERVIPAREPEDAERLREELGRENCILGGERGCNKLPGFDAGNSPLEYTREAVKGKTVVITTSNGSSAIKSADDGDSVLIGALINRTAAAKRAIAEGRNVTIFCAGTNRKISADDLCAAGAIIDAIREQGAETELTDAAQISIAIYKAWKDGKYDLLAAAHCRRLLSLGYGADIEYCLREDTTDVVPEYKNGEIR